MTVQINEPINNRLHSLIPLEEFKALLSIDDREDRISRFCLATATFSIEQYCKRRLLQKKHFERIEYYGDLLLPLREYPVISMSLEPITMNIAVNPHPYGFTALSFWHAKTQAKAGETTASMPSKAMFLDPAFYRVIPECGTNMDFPYSIELFSAVRRLRGIDAFKVVYWAGYKQGKVPPDLASACLELAMWNMNRYKGRRIGMTGSVRGNGNSGEHLETSMPENVRSLLEPYKRKTI